MRYLELRDWNLCIRQGIESAPEFLIPCLLGFRAQLRHAADGCLMGSVTSLDQFHDVGFSLFVHLFRGISRIFGITCSAHVSACCFS